ncbi:MAG: hypothetical protein QNJ60_16975 [Xenococcaceae cyanobacterium MO_188.B19]|nr:hypothetical protein [Xenococcaceae cyanobacterium MO_188.B19]
MAETKATTLNAKRKTMPFKNIIQRGNDNFNCFLIQSLLRCDRVYPPIL